MSRKFKIRNTEGQVREIAMPEKPRRPLGVSAKPADPKPAEKPETEKAAKDAKGS